MARIDIDRELSALGLSARWVELGILSDEHLDPMGIYRTSLGPFATDPPVTGERVVQSALYRYLGGRTALDDAMLAELLDLAGGIGTSCSSTLADWGGLEHRQLAHVAGHRATAPEVRRLAAQKLWLMTLPAESGHAVDLLGLQGASEGDPGAFKIRMFHFTAAWRRRLSSREREHVAALLVRLRRAEQAKCHMPVFGLRVTPASAYDQFQVSICFECNNIFLDGGGVIMFNGKSQAAVELLNCFLALSPSGWPRRAPGVTV